MGRCFEPCFMPCLPEVVTEIDPVDFKTLPGLLKNNSVRKEDRKAALT